MNCIMCNTEIPKGKRFQSPRYKAEHFCSEDCYNRFVKMKSAPRPPINYKPAQGSERRKLTDLIQELYGEGANWAWLTSQIKDLKEEFDLTDNDLRLTIKYAIEYEGYEPELAYGLRQFIKFITPAQEFAKTINYNREIAQDLEDDDVVRVSCRGEKKRRNWREK